MVLFFLVSALLDRSVFRFFKNDLFSFGLCISHLASFFFLVSFRLRQFRLGDDRGVSAVWRCSWMCLVFCFHFFSIFSGL